MSHNYASCRICHRPKTEVKLSSRGRCTSCAIGNMAASIAANVAAVHMAHDHMADVIPLQTAFASLEDTRST